MLIQLYTKKINIDNAFVLHFQNISKQLYFFRGYRDSLSPFSCDRPCRLCVNIKNAIMNIGQWCRNAIAYLLGRKKQNSMHCEDERPAHPSMLNLPCVLEDENQLQKMRALYKKNKANHQIDPQLPQQQYKRNLRAERRLAMRDMRKIASKSL
jgi:hypothetical protein